MANFYYENIKVYYERRGSGHPLLLLHGNTTSTKLFKSDIPFFSQYFDVISFDYPGHGLSDYMEHFREDFWYFNSLVAIELLNHLKIDETYIIGTSGGALVALNIATQQPELAPLIIADSFFGNRLSSKEAEKIVKSRQKAKSDFMNIQYWKQFNPNTWEHIVDEDCRVLLAIGQKKLPLIYGDLSKIKSEVLLVGTSTDDVIPDIPNRLSELAEIIPNSDLKLYDYGRHTFMITEKEEFRRIALDFLEL